MCIKYSINRWLVSSFHNLTTLHNPSNDYTLHNPSNDYMLHNQSNDYTLHNPSYYTTVPFEKALSVIISADESSKAKTPMFSRAYSGAVVALLPVPAAITAPLCNTQRMQTCDSLTL